MRQAIANKSGALAFAASLPAERELLRSDHGGLERCSRRPIASQGELTNPSKRRKQFKGWPDLHQATDTTWINARFGRQSLFRGEMSEDDAQSLHRGTGGSTYTRKARATREAPKRGQG